MSITRNTPEGTKTLRHIAIIMDGNGRWAKKRGLPRTAGHLAGAETFRTIARLCRNKGIDYLTVYAFSTENWKRSADEVNALMGIFKKYLAEAVDSLAKNHVRLKVLGDRTALSPELNELIDKVESISEHINGMQANLCINYGGRDEIVKAIKAWENDPNREEMSEETLAKYLYSAGIPNPDLVCRTSGELRLSNFLIWQAAYSEFYFTDTHWPDFDEEELDKAIDSYFERDRRFGGTH